MKAVVLLLFLGYTVNLGWARHTTGPSSDGSCDCDCLKGSRKTIEESNKELVLEFYQKVFGDLDFAAIDDDKYIKEPYIQHNPRAADGREGLKEVVKNLLKGAPKRKLDIRRVGADGDLVWVHQKMDIHGHDNSVMDIMRVENGKIVEHWATIQPVPEKSLNNNTMF